MLRPTLLPLVTLSLAGDVVLVAVADEDVDDLRRVTQVDFRAVLAVSGEQ